MSDSTPDRQSGHGIPEIPDDASNSDNRRIGETPSEIHWHDVAPAVEFCCWVVVALAPFLRWVNGPAVTSDQFVIQLSLVTLAAAGAVGLRIYNWRRSRP